MAIPVLCLPVYVVTLTNNLSYEHQVTNITLLAILTTISLAIMSWMHKWEITSKASSSTHPASPQNIATRYVSTPSEQLLSDYDQYLKKIDALNQNFYVDEEGIVKNFSYSRSSSHILG